MSDINPSALQGEEGLATTASDTDAQETTPERRRANQGVDDSDEVVSTTLDAGIHGSVADVTDGGR